MSPMEREAGHGVVVAFVVRWSTAWRSAVGAGRGLVTNYCWRFSVFWRRSAWSIWPECAHGSRRPRRSPSSPDVLRGQLARSAAVVPAPHGGNREVLAVERHGVLAGCPVGELLRGVEFLVPLWMPKAPGPSRDLSWEHKVDRRTFALLLLPRYSNEMPSTNSPDAAMLQGFEPEWVYCAMFSCRPFMNCQPPPLCRCRHRTA